jgi:hypothetical protein
MNGQMGKSRGYISCSYQKLRQAISKNPAYFTYLSVQLQKTAAENRQEEIPKLVAGVEGLLLPIVFE